MAGTDGEGPALFEDQTGGQGEVIVLHRLGYLGKGEAPGFQGRGIHGDDDLALNLAGGANLQYAVYLLQPGQDLGLYHGGGNFRPLLGQDAELNDGYLVRAEAAGLRLFHASGEG